MKHNEYTILKEWKSKTPKEKSFACASHITDVMQSLVDKGLLEPITRSDGLSPGNRILVGYDVTMVGEDAFNEYMRQQI